MSFFKKLFASEPDPFMEHPGGTFKSVVDAMEDAIMRLRKRSTWDEWITFGAQGQGEGPDDYEFAEIRMLKDKLDVGEKSLDIARIIQAARVNANCLSVDGAQYSVTAASPREAAQVLDAIFRHHFGLRPFADEGDDYAVGAEW